MKYRKLAGAAVILTALAITGCGSVHFNSNGSSAADGENAAVSSEGSAEGSSAETATDKKERIPFEEMTVVDNDLCSIRITDLIEDGEYGYSLILELANKAMDSVYTYELQDASINGVSVDSLFSMEIPPSISFPSIIDFSNEQMREYELGDITDIELTFVVYESETQTGEYAASETVHIYPYGEEYAETFLRQDQDTDLTVFENDSVKVVVIGTKESVEEGLTANVYLENKTDDSMIFFIESASVNGEEADPYWSRLLPAEKAAFSDVTWQAYELEEAGIGTDDPAAEIAFTMLAYKGGDFASEESMNETFTIELR